MERDLAGNIAYSIRPEGDCPPTWYDQPHTGRFNLHCFYEPTGDECSNIYNAF